MYFRLLYNCWDFQDIGIQIAPLSPSYIQSLTKCAVFVSSTSKPELTRDEKILLLPKKSTISSLHRVRAGRVTKKKGGRLGD